MIGRAAVATLIALAFFVGACHSNDEPAALDRAKLQVPARVETPAFRNLGKRGASDLKAEGRRASEPVIR